MKLIIAIVRPFTLDKIVNALEEIENFSGITVSDSEGFGQRLKTPNDALNPFKPNKRLEIICDDKSAEKIVAAIRTNSHTGKKGDGIIYVLPVEQSIVI